MDLKRAMRNLAKVISEEADHNPEFESRVREALGLSAAEGENSRERKATDAGTTTSTRGRNRRTPAVLDPIQLALKSEEVLREQLSQLTVDQLKDIVADHGMDPSKLVMKWRTRGSDCQSHCGYGNFAFPKGRRVPYLIAIKAQLKPSPFGMQGFWNGVLYRPNSKNGRPRVVGS